jgi:hypothetical protein
VRIPHVDRTSASETHCLGRIVSISRSNVLYSEALGEGMGEVNVLPGSMVSGETLYARARYFGLRYRTKIG